MAGLNGLVLGFRADANIRINKFTVMTKYVTNVTTQNKIYAAVASGANGGPILGVTIEHFIEPNYFVPEGTDPSTVTGSTPTLYNLQGKAINLQVNGVARCIASGAIAQGDELTIADAYGRVQTNAVTVGSVAYVIGYAQNAAAATNDIVQVLIEPSTKKM